MTPCNGRLGGGNLSVRHIYMGKNIEKSKAARVGFWPKFPFLLLFYILATSKFILQQVLTCDSPHSWRINSAVPLGEQVSSSIIQYPHTVILSRHCANPSLYYPINVKRQDR